MGWEISLEPYLENTIFHKTKEMSKQQEAGITGSFIVQDLTLKHWTPTELPADWTKAIWTPALCDAIRGEKNDTAMLC